jgi:flagellar biosynthesis/type III secretory pathway chaperone
MAIRTKNQELLINLEDLLVQEFRTLQELIAVTKKEREVLSKNDTIALMRLIEEKEVVLDQLGLMEDNRHMLLQDLAVSLGKKTQSYSLKELLPLLTPAEAGRLDRLSDGIMTLVSQARELNYGNRALAVSMTTWLQSAQNFMLNVSHPQVFYRPTGVSPKLETAAVGGFDHRA